MSEASAIIQEAAHEEANIIFGAVVDPKMQGRVKVTVIATGFDRPGLFASARPSNTETPVDLSAYAAWRQETVSEKVAAAGGSSAPRLTVSRRPAVDLPLIPKAAPANDGPGAEFEPASPLDVPAFLRRQTD